MLPLAPPRSADAGVSARPRIVCGTTLLDADPKVDPRIQLPTVETKGKFSIRAVQPPICGAGER
jgi:hypothetical protein